MPISKRAALVSALESTGLLGLVERVARRPGLLVVNYHRVGWTPDNALDDGIFSATTEAFRSQVRYLRDSFDLPSVEEIVKASREGFRFRRPSALITFDDGYRDNFDVALPILRELGAHALFFVPTSHVGQSRLPWWDRIAYMVKKTRVSELVLDRPEPIRLDLRMVSRAFAFKTIQKAIQKQEQVDEDGVCAHFAERSEVSMGDELVQTRLFLTWSEMQQMVAAGMTIGGHTDSHKILAGLPEAQQRDELTRSKQLLEEKLGRPITTLAYPEGGRASFSARTKQLAREAGYALAFSFYEGINRPGEVDPFDVQRIYVDRTISLPLFRTRAVLYRALGRSL